MITVTIARDTPSQNKFTYTHWRAYKRDRDTWMTLLRAQLKPPTYIPAQMWMIIESRRRTLLDYGNYVGGCKGLIDCLVRLGYLKDDSPRWLHCTYEQMVAPEPFRCTTIKISPTPFVIEHDPAVAGLVTSP